MSLIDNMVALNARLTAIPVRLGLKQHRDLLIRHSRLHHGLLADFCDTVLEPKPYIESVPQSMVGMELDGSQGQQSSLGIRISKDDFLASNIPRSYSLEFLREGVEFFVIDPPLDDSDRPIYDGKGNPSGGIFCKCVHVDDRDLLTWTLILRKFRDHYTTGDILR
jgi:hypothetical protein